MRLVFVETRGQASYLRSTTLEGVSVVAVTAIAVQALEEFKVPHTAVSAYSDLRPLARADEQLVVSTVRLARELDAFVADRHPPARFDGPGPVEANAYALQHAAWMIARRFVLMRDAIRACQPSSIGIFDADLDPWFVGDGYLQDPWTCGIIREAEQAGIAVERLPVAPDEESDRLSGWVARSKALFPRMRARLGRGWRRTGGRNEPPQDLAGLRLVFVNATTFDWAPVVASLRTAAGVSCFRTTTAPLDARWWNSTFSPRVERLWGRPPVTLDLSAASVDERESEHIHLLFNDWLRAADRSSALTAGDVDILPMLSPHLRGLLGRGPSLIRYTDRYAELMLKEISPDAVCFFAIARFADQRLAHVCRQQGVPVLSYQHGLGYSVRIQPADEMCDPVFADYFMTYGEGNHPRPRPAFPVRARYVPVGSSRIEHMPRRAAPRVRHRGKLRLLWAAEVFIGNTVGVSVTEETQRYALYQRGLRILSGVAGVEVTYRPYPHLPDGVARWIETTALPNVHVDTTTPFEVLARGCDLAIVAASSSTIWGELTALGVPMVLYCDPEQTLLTDEFTGDLDRACRWCRTSESLVADLRRFSDDPSGFTRDVARIDQSDFVKKYVLHEGNCTNNVVSFINEVRHAGRPNKKWQPA